MKRMHSESGLLASKYYLFLGIFLILVTFISSLLAYYYFHNSLSRQVTFFLMILSLGALFWGTLKDLESEIKSKKIVWFALLILFFLYFVQRVELPRFDFMIGDASDYFAAGICSVTYGQDIGYILPMSATITALGYEIFGIKNVLFVYVILYSVSIPVFYFLFRKFQLTPFLSFLMSLFFVCVPLSIWFSKTSFTEPIWQILLFIFVINMYMVLQKNIINRENILAIYIIALLVPMLRVEGIFYFGLLFFLALYHFWKYQNLKVPLLLGIGIFIVTISTHVAIRLRPDYMLNRQFSRLIPHATEENVMLMLYSLAGIAIGLIILIYFMRKWFVKISFNKTVVIGTLFVKLTIAYMYSVKKNMVFLDILFMNEYGFAVGNFGLPIVFLIIVGLAILYLKAFRGDVISLLLVVLYTIFYLPFAMQSVTFADPHGFFLYWNRYYFSVLMPIHIIGLALVVKLVYDNLQKIIHKKTMRMLIITFFVGVLSILSIDGKLYKIVVQESYFKDSYKLYERVKENIGHNGIYIVSEDSVVYKQNDRPDGLEKIEYLIGRMFTLHHIQEKGHEAILAKRLYSNQQYHLPEKHIKYILCAGKKECHLRNERLQMLDTFKVPLEWREHFGLDSNASFVHHGDIAKSIVKHMLLHITLYRVK